ncbi:ribonuclease D [Formicincola oecophyllae]|uniref:Ribonuclease D n=1 Tax=Formicincola oecophyllae TaxID=2558361 RepID=A0A4Y6U8W0_9PROT|nr:ribonuclease D [Formicincola oecophyllae]QDH13903.1 ribonuclease D [Formicincola oecophyllae]
MGSESKAIHLHDGDLPDGLDLGPVVAIDTETMGLDQRRDRLCLVQISSGDGTAHLVQIKPESMGGKGANCPNLKAMLENPNVKKLMHYARFDVGILQHALGVRMTSVICTKIAARLVYTFTDKHGLAFLTKDLLGIEMSKQQQCSDWGAPELTPEQLQYAASDVLHLHALWEKLEAMLVREGRRELAQQCFDFLPTRAELDSLGYDHPDIFSHSARL